MTRLAFVNGLANLMTNAAGYEPPAVDAALMETNDGGAQGVTTT